MGNSHIILFFVSRDKRATPNLHPWATIGQPIVTNVFMEMLNERGSKRKRDDAVAVMDLDLTMMLHTLYGRHCSTS